MALESNKARKFVFQAGTPKRGEARFVLYLLDGDFADYRFNSRAIDKLIDKRD